MLHITRHSVRHLTRRFQSSLSITSRSYSTTPSILKDEEKDVFHTINNTKYSDEEIEKIFQEEEEAMRLAKEKKTVKNWKPGMRKRPLTISYSLEDFEYELKGEGKQPKWSLRDKRCGAIATKLGMTAWFDEWGARHPVTVLYLDENVVMGNKTEERDGYMAVKVAAGNRKRKNVGKSVLGQYKDILGPQDNPPYIVREFRVTDPSLLLPVNTRIHARHFVPGQNIDVAGISKGKGFQGPMKRHNFKGMPASHGVSLTHRAHGSVGSCQDPGKVFKGKKMAGRMGAERVTVQNIRVVKVDRGRNLLYIEGTVPGNKGAFVEIRDSVKKPLWRTDKVLGNADRPPLPTFEYEELDGSGTGGHEEIMPMPSIDPLLPIDDEAA